MSSFYKFDIIAKTGQLNLSGIEDNPSINDAGNVAFVGQLTTGGKGIFVGNVPGAATAIANTPYSNPGFSRGVQINNKNQVVGQLQRPGPITAVYVWDGNNPGSAPKLIATGGQEINFPLPPLYDFDAVFSHPSINNNGDVVFSSIEGTTRFLATGKLGPASGFYTTPTQVPARPMIADDGQIVVRLGNQLGNAVTNTPPSPIKLFSSDFSSSENIATASMGFTQLGISPGMSDDAQIVTFYGNLGTGDGESFTDSNGNGGWNPGESFTDSNGNGTWDGTNPGAGIFASIKTPTGRVIERIAGVAGNGFLDPGETFNDANNNRILDVGEDLGSIASFNPDVRIAVNSTHKDGTFGPSQRAVTIVYMANDQANHQGIYTSRLNFFGTGSSNFDPNNPGAASVSQPTLVVEQGDTIGGLDGTVQSLNIYDSVNNRDRGDVAFWVKTTDNQQAVVRARPQEVIYLDFKPRTNFKPSRDLGTSIFDDLGLPVAWADNLASVFSTLAPDRADLNGAANIAIIQNAITNQVRQAFEDIGINVRILNSESDSIPTDGRFTHVYIGDGPRPIGNPFPDGALGIASSVDFFNQDLFQGDEQLKGEVRFGKDTAFVFADLIFDPASGRFTDPDINIVSLNQTTGPGTITTDQVVNAIARVTLHEIGHALGLAHLKNGSSSNLLMDVSIDQDELRKSANFATTDQPLAEVNDVQNDQQRLAFTVGSDNNNLVRTPPSSLLLSKYNRSKFLLSAFLNQGSINVSKAAIGIVPLGEDHIMPELIDLGSGDLATLLNREIEVRNGDKIFLIASTDGNGIDIFSVANGFSGNVGDIDLTNGLLVITDEHIRGSFVDTSGQPIATSLNLFQETANGFVQIGQLGAGQANSLPTLSITSTQIAEGNNGTQNILLTVSLSAANAQTVTVNFASSDNTAISGSDYQAVNGTLTFNPGGLLTQTITIPIYGDSTVELDESFSVNLTSPTNATIAVSQGVITIQNDDVPSSKPATPDFNGDGKADILWRNPTIGRADLWKMDGSTRLSAAIVTSTVGSAWEVVGTSDFTGDGKADILWRNPTIGRADLWEMDGSTRLSSTVVTSTVGSAWEVVGTSDFTGDGKADILWRNPTIGRADLWEMDGSTRLSAAIVTSTVGSAWEVVGTSDFTGDGKADILWRNPTIGRADLWEMDGSTRLSAAIVTSAVGSAWRVAGTQDFSGDGLSDILWRNSDLGRADLWTMSGSSRLSSSVVASNVGSTWRIVN
jgi:hypothetical protein